MTVAPAQTRTAGHRLGLVAIAGLHLLAGWALMRQNDLAWVTVVRQPVEPQAIQPVVPPLPSPVRRANTESVTVPAPAPAPPAPPPKPAPKPEPPPPAAKPAPQPATKPVAAPKPAPVAKPVAMPAPAPIPAPAQDATPAPVRTARPIPNPIPAPDQDATPPAASTPSAAPAPAPAPMPSAAPSPAPAPPAAAPAPAPAPAHSGVRTAPLLRFSDAEKPEYTLEARRAEIECTVRIAYTMDTDGSVSDVRVVSSCGSSREHRGLDRAALAAARTVRGKPGTLDGRPERMSGQVEYAFRLDGPIFLETP